MLHASTQKLITKLCEFTEAGHISWQRGGTQVCRFETEGYVVEVQGQPATLRLLHSDGHELERADEHDLSAQPWPDGNGTFATHITLLAARADRIARGAELAISRILSSLSAPPKSAKPAAEIVDRPPPPAPHTTPGPPPSPMATDTAIDRVLAVAPNLPRTIEPPEPEPEPEPVIMESEAVAVVGDPEAVEEAVAEAAAEAEAAVEARAPETPPVEPVPKPAEQPIIPRPQKTFGAIQSFARPGNLSATPRATAPKTFSTSPLFFGVNQMSREPVHTEPAPPPVPAPAPKPVPPAPPVAEKKPEPAIAGPDIYKPWS